MVQSATRFSLQGQEQLFQPPRMPSSADGHQPYLCWVGWFWSDCGPRRTGQAFKECLICYNAKKINVY